MNTPENQGKIHSRAVRIAESDTILLQVSDNFDIEGETSDTAGTLIARVRHSGPNLSAQRVTLHADRTS